MTPTTRLTIILGLASLALAACGAPALPSGPGPATATSASPGGKYRCENVTGASEPWLVEWEPVAKVRLQSESQSGVLLVRSGAGLYPEQRPGWYHSLVREARKE